MTQTVEHNGKAVIAYKLIGDLHLRPRIEMTWVPGTSLPYESAAYEGYLAGFMTRMDAFMAQGIQGITFASTNFVEFDKGYLFLNSSVDVEVTPDDEELFHLVQRWDATLPEEGQDQDDDNVRLERAIETRITEMIEKKASDNGYITSASFSTTCLGATFVFG